MSATDGEADPAARRAREHADWLRDHERALIRHQHWLAEHEAAMQELTRKLDKLTDLILRNQSGNGENGAESRR